MPPSAARKRPGRSCIAPVNAPFTCPNSADIAASPRSVAQFTSTKRPFTSRRCFFRAWMRCASCDLPAPVGPMSRIGADEAIATRSMRSISALKRALRVAMPAFRKDSASCCSTRKREAMRSYLDRSRSMIEYEPTPGVSPPARGDVWISRAGRSRASVSRNRQICATCVPVVTWTR